MVDHILPLSISVPSGGQTQESDRPDDPNYHNAMDGSHSPRMCRPPSPSRGNAQQPGDTASLEERHQRELIELKLQLAKQQEANDVLSSKLEHFQALIEALRAENTSLVDEVALARDAAEGQASISSSIAGAFSSFGKGQGGNGGSMQMLVDSNARLIFDNARLQVSVDGLRKAFQSYIKHSQRTSQGDRETIEALQSKNESLRKQQSVAGTEHKKTSLGGESTSLTSLLSEEITDESKENMDAQEDSSQRPIINQDNVHVDSKHFTSECPGKLIISSDDWFIEGRETECELNDSGKIKLGKKVGKIPKTRGSRPGELLVDFGESRRARSSRKRWHSAMW